MEVWSIRRERSEKIEKDKFKEDKKQPNSLLEMTQNLQKQKIISGEVNVDSSLNPNAPVFIPLQGPENGPNSPAMENTISPSRVEVPGRVVIPIQVSPFSPVVYPSRFGTPGTVYYFPWYQVPSSAIPVMSSNQYGTSGAVYFYNMNEN